MLLLHNTFYVVAVVAVVAVVVAVAVVAAAAVAAVVVSDDIQPRQRVLSYMPHPLVRQVVIDMPIHHYIPKGIYYVYILLFVVVVVCCCCCC